MRVSQSRRRGFTLVELLVAVGIILVLSGLALLLANSGIIGNIRTSSGSDRIVGWLMQARSKAQRDGAPRGIRFIVDPTTGYCREAQLIEVPETYTMPVGNRLMIEHVFNAGPPPVHTRRAFVVGPNATDVTLNVAIGDTLSIPSTNTIHRVTGFGAPTTVTLGAQVLPAVEILVADWTKLPNLGAAALTVAPAPGTAQPTYSTGTFGFIRQARPTFGEPPLLVPDTVAIILNPANTTNPTNPLPGPQSLSLLPMTNGNYDIVFSPNGEVQNAGGLGRFVLWTANPDALAAIPVLPTADGPRNGGDLLTTYEVAGEMRHVVVYTKTGAVAVQPISPPVDNLPATPHDPYANTKDGVGSGL